MKLELTELPDSIKFRKLLRKVMNNDEEALEELQDYIDSISLEKIALKKVIKSIRKTINNI